MELNFRKSGAGRPVVILHGLFGLLDNWQTIAKNLSERFTVYLLDQRNHGRSFHHEEFNYNALAEDLKRFIDKNELLKPHIIGHSMGGKTAMQFSANYPNWGGQLVVVDIAPKAYSHTHQDIIEALNAVNLSGNSSREEIDAQLSLRIPELSTRQFLMKSLYRTEQGEYAWRFNLPVITEKIDKILEATKSSQQVYIPTLFVRGSKSKYIQDSDLPLIRTLYPNSRVESIEGAGHWVHAEKPMELLELLNGFLRGE